MTTFAEQVAAALAKVPHAETCWLRSTSMWAYLAKQAARCTCDREQRIAERVAAAIEAAEWAGTIDEDAERAALRALNGEESRI